MLISVGGGMYQLADSYNYGINPCYPNQSLGYKSGINAENLQYSGSSKYENRPYQDSPQTIQNIVDSVPPTVDSKGSAGLYWKFDGVYNGSQGTYELLISPDKTTIWHFLFRSK